MLVQNWPMIQPTTTFLVVRFVEGEAWFWGQYRTQYRAQAVAEDIGGVVIDLAEEEV